MTNSNPLSEKLAQTIGGEWQTTNTVSHPVQGLVATFPQFRSNAIVGVLNKLAVAADAEEKVVALASSPSARMLGDDPYAPRDVVVPKELADNPRFRDALNENVKQAISTEVSHQLSSTVGKGLAR